MTRVLVTGGTGTLGRKLVPKLVAAGYAVRVMSRQASSANRWPGVEWVQADLETGAGLHEAVAGVDTIVHAASNVVFRTAAVDVAGTQRLLEQARASHITHFLYVSIVGIERVPYSYYRHKVEAEQLVSTSDLPWSILRATQFHNLIDIFLRALAKPPLVLMPTDFKYQPIDVGEVADYLGKYVAAGAGGRLSDLAGPEVRTFGDLAQAWFAAQGVRRRIIHLPVPGAIAHAFRRGYVTSPQHHDGHITWEAWLKTRYAKHRYAKQGSA